MRSPCEIVLALDVPSRADAETFLDRIGPNLKWVKIGLQLFVREGPVLLDMVAARGHRIFLDLKLHDIPNTVSSAIRSLRGRPCELLTVHAAGGAEMLRQAAMAAAETSPNLRLLAVTVLTSLDAQALVATGIHATPASQVERLAALALDTGIPGLVCSPEELPALRARFGPTPLLVTPGIRPPGSDPGDQKRSLTPAAAAAAGADLLVVGRPLLQAADPRAALAALHATLHGARNA